MSASKKSKNPGRLWCLDCLPDLVWPAEGLGRWDPRFIRAFHKKEFQRRLDLAGRSRQDAQARCWLAESLLDRNPGQALRLLRLLPGPLPALYRGAALMKLKRWKPAAEAFIAARQTWQGQDAALASLLAACAFLRAGLLRKALEALHRCRAHGGDEAVLYWLYAFTYERLGQMKPARLSVEQAMRRFSELALDPLLGPRLRRENQRGGRCRPPSARTLALLKAARRGPVPVWALVAQAETLRDPRFSRYREALPLLRRAARLAPRSGWVWAYLGRGLESVGQAAQAKRALERAVRLSPESGWIRAWHGSWLLRHARPSALPQLRRAACLLPGYPFAHAWLGGALRQAGRLKEAARQLELAIALEPGYEWSFAELFQVRRRQKDWARAALMVTQAYEREMKFTWADRDDPNPYESALKELDAAVASRPDLLLLQAWRAWALLGLGRSDEARRQASAAARAANAPAFAYAVAAACEETRGFFENALTLYGKAASLRPCTAYLGSRGLLLYRMGRNRAALADLQRATELNGTVARFQCTLGAVLEELGRPRAALEALDKAAGLDPHYSEVLARRAGVLQSLGRRRPARQALALARRLRPDCPWAALTASRLAVSEVAACAELIKVVDHGAELPPRILDSARRRMGRLARRALRRLDKKASLP